MATIAGMSDAGTSRGDRRIAGVVAASVNAMIVVLMLVVPAVLWTAAAGVVHLATDRDWGAAYSSTVAAPGAAFVVILVEERRRRRRARGAG